MNKIWKISIRNILKNKAFSTINIVGLTLGFAGFMVVALFIRYEFSWDKTHENYENIYRVQRHYTKTAFARDGNDISPHTYAKTASLIESFPEFKKVTVIQEELGKYLSSDPEKQVYDETGIIADNNFFDVFTYQFKEGEPKNILEEPFTILLSETMAQKLFNDKNAIGQTVFYEKKEELKVTGVFADLPENSTIKPSYIISLSTLERLKNFKRNESWWGNFMTYALLTSEADVTLAESKIKNIYAEFENHKLEELQLCPLSKIHLSFNDRNDYYIILTIFGFIGFFILTMSAFNYVNFTIATASGRGKEVAIRKLSGAGKFSLAVQIQIETLLISIAASVLAMGLVKIILPTYNSFVNSSISLSLANDWKTLFLLLLASVSIGLISGLYPAKVIASRRIVKLLKEGMFTSFGDKFNTKKTLVTLQFTISIFLICLTLFFVAQINFMFTKDMGFEMDNLLYTKLSTEQSNKNFEQLRSQLLQHPEIINASMSSYLPFINMGGGMINWEGSQSDEKVLYRPNYVSYDFIENMGIEIVKGRNFSENFSADLNKSCIINEAALKCFGWKEPIGKKIKDKKWTVIGVVKNYHIQDIHNSIDPVVLLLSDNNISGDLTFAIRYSSGNLSKVKQILTKEFTSFFPNDPFEFSDMETAMANENTFKIYKTIQQSIIFYTIFIVLLAVVALLGMVSYALARRTKEIGIRKVNGSSVKKLFLLLNRDYIILLGISMIIATPLSFFVYRALPGNFKIPPPIWIPFLSAFIILLIIVLTTGLQTLRAARMNPVKALRYE